MGKHFVSTCNRRPSVDVLESRYLLSGGIGVFSVSTAPAVVGSDFQLSLRPLGIGGPVLMSSFSYDPHPFDVAPFGSSPLVAPLVQYRVPQSLVMAAPRWEAMVSPNSGFGTVSVMQSSSAVESLFMPAQQTLESSQRAGVGFSIPPGPPPLHAGLMLGSPDSLVISGSFAAFSPADYQRYRPEDPTIPHPPLDKPPADPSGLDAPPSLIQIQTASSATSPATQQEQATVVANQNVQANVVGVSVAAPPAHVTVAFGVDRVHGEQTTRIGQSEDGGAGQLLEAGQATVPTASPVAAVSSTSTALTIEKVEQSVIPPVAGLSSNGLSDHEELPLPQTAGLITNAVPFDRAALEKAVDQFFDQLEALGTGQFADQATAQALPISLVLLGAVTVVEVARRRLRSKGVSWNSAARQDSLSSEELLGFPELPGSWSTRLT